MQTIEINARRVILSLAFFCLGILTTFLWGAGLHSLAVPSAILFSSFLGTYVAIVSVKNARELAQNNVKNARELAQKKASIDFVEALHEGEKIQESINAILRFEMLSENLSLDEVKLKYADLEILDNRDREMVARMMYALNLYEYMSIGIFEGIYDESIIN